MQQLRRHGVGMPGVRGRLESALGLGLQAISSHQAGHPVPAGGFAAALELPIDPGAAIGAATVPVDLGNLLGQQPVGSARRALGATKPTVKAASRNLERPAQNRHRVLSLMIPDEAIPHFGSLEKMATAFFKMSRSIRSRSFSRWSFPSASASVSRCPLPGKASWGRSEYC